MYCVQEPLGINFSSESTMFYLSFSEEVEVVSRGCWAGAAPTVFQLLIQGASLLVLPRILESEWRSRAEGFKQKADLWTIILAG